MNKDFTRFLKKISKGPIKYKNPDDLDYKNIDKKLVGFINDINSSNFCRTLWSCQGHYIKKNNIMLPYLTFVVKTEKFSFILNEIYKTLPVNKSKEYPVHSPHYIEINKGYSDDKFTIMSFHWSKSYVCDKKIRRQFFQTLNEIGKNIKNEK